MLEVISNVINSVAEKEITLHKKEHNMFTPFGIPKFLKAPWNDSTFTNMGVLKERVDEQKKNIMHFSKDFRYMGKKNIN